MNTYAETLDVCECGHRGYMHAPAGGKLRDCVAANNHGVPCSCRKFTLKEAAK